MSEVGAATYARCPDRCPMNFDPSMIPGGVALTWTSGGDDADYGHKGYQYAHGRWEQ